MYYGELLFMYRLYGRIILTKLYIFSHNPMPRYILLPIFHIFIIYLYNPDFHYYILS